VFKVKNICGNSSTPPQEPQKNNGRASFSISIPIPVKYWVDCKAKEFVVEYSNGSLQQIQITEEKIKEYINEGVELRNL
jgi:hypothetical protein